MTLAPPEISIAPVYVPDPSPLKSTEAWMTSLLVPGVPSDVVTESHEPSLLAVALRVTPGPAEASRFSPGAYLLDPSMTTALGLTTMIPENARAAIICHSNCRADKTDLCLPLWVFEKVEAAGIRIAS